MPKELGECYHCNHLILPGDVSVANLVVRNLDQRLVDALKQRAANAGRSAEAEHRRILEEALFAPPKRSLAEVLAAMPDVGQDSDFARREDREPAARVFD